MFLSLGNCFVCIFIATGFAGAVDGAQLGPGLPDPVSASCSNGTGLEHIGLTRRLISCLLKDYDPAVRPTLKPVSPVDVSFDSVIFTINSLNEKTGILTTDSWLKQTWIDVQLKWNASDFGNIDEIRLPAEKLWTPEIVLQNNADESFRYAMDKLVVVNSSGHVTWVPHGRLHSFCRLDLTLFPYDTQICRLYFGSWAYDGALVSIRTRGGMQFLPKTPDWEVMDYFSEIVSTYDGAKKYPAALYTVYMKRVSVYYKYMLVAPSVVLACLTLLLFWIPLESKERFMLGTGILVSLSVLHLLLEDCLPTELGKLPIIASYLGFNLFLLVITLSISVVTMNCYYRGVQSQTVPSWMRWMFLGRLSRLMCIRMRRYAEPVAFTVEHSTGNDQTAEFRDLLPESTQNDGRKDADATAKNLEKTMDDIRRYLRLLSSKSETTVAGHHVTPHSELVQNEWHQLALVIDRLMFFIFLFITVLTTIVMYGHS